jgi:CRP-like cAMP-binding protein
MHATRDDKINALAEVPLFAGCGQHELVQLAKVLDTSWATSGEMLETQGQRTRWWKIIIFGTASVTRDGRPTGLIGAGDWWGERSIINRTPSSLSVVALTPVALLTMERRDFLKLPGRHPLVAARIMSELVDRRAPYEGLAIA